MLGRASCVACEITVIDFPEGPSFCALNTRLHLNMYTLLPAVDTACVLGSAEVSPKLNPKPKAQSPKL